MNLSFFFINTLLQLTPGIIILVTNGHEEKEILLN